MPNLLNVKLRCPGGGDCEFETISLPYDQASEQLDGQAPVGSSNKHEKFPRPEIKLDSTAEDLEEFSLKWSQYKEEYNLADAGLIRQFFACCGLFLHWFLEI